MITVGIAEWERALEGLRRGSLGALTQANSVDGDDCIREYLAGDGAVVMRMVTAGAALPGPVPPGAEQVFTVSEHILERTSEIYMPTQEQWDEWDDSGNDLDGMAEAAKIDPGWLL